MTYKKWFWLCKGTLTVQRNLWLPIYYLVTKLSAILTFKSSEWSELSSTEIRDKKKLYKSISKGLSSFSKFNWSQDLQFNTTKNYYSEYFDFVYISILFFTKKCIKSGSNWSCSSTLSQSYPDFWFHPYFITRNQVLWSCI